MWRVCVCSSEGTHLEATGRVGCLSRLYSILFFETGSLDEPDLTDPTGQQALAIILFCLPNVEAMGWSLHVQFYYMGTGDLNTGRHACKAPRLLSHFPSPCTVS